ncbi:hypothetical protein [Bartonella florencae]|uniref:hypothetical protein n=1 Tax=Bartonella florencae TaxID=928210 RepID=UPI00030C1839|nr:hypothetical protein [Bartonella florencae]
MRFAHDISCKIVHKAAHSFRAFRALLQPSSPNIPPTIPPAILEALVSQLLTDKGLQIFIQND